MAIACPAAPQSGADTKMTADLLTEVRLGRLVTYADPVMASEIQAFTREFVARRAQEQFGVAVRGPLDGLHRELSREQMALIVKKAHTQRAALMALPLAIARAVERSGLADRVLISFNEHLRLIPPEAPGVKTLGVPPHRDSWYSLPKESINVWIPCTAAPGIAVYAKHFGVRLKVGHRDPANKHHRVKGIDFSLEQPVHPEVAPGEALLFSGNHLHRSRLNESDATRVSWDYRMLLVDTLAPSLRLHEFVFVDLLLADPADLPRMHRETQKRLRARSFSLWAYRTLSGSRRPKLPFTRLGRAVKNAFPGVFYS